MRFGTQTTIRTKNGITRMHVQKYNNFDVTTDETLCEERVPIIRITDANTVLDDMHITHALTDYGIWIEKNPVSGKLYVIKTWIEKAK